MAAREAQGEQERAARARVQRMLQRYLARGRYCLNPDLVTVEHVLAGLTRNLLEHGRWYCPCREVTGDAERDLANLCPCPQHPADIAREGACECGLLVSHEYVALHSPCGRAETGKES